MVMYGTFYDLFIQECFTEKLLSIFYVLDTVLLEVKKSHNLT